MWLEGTLGLAWGWLRDGSKVAKGWLGVARGCERGLAPSASLSFHFISFLYDILIYGGA